MGLWDIDKIPYVGRQSLRRPPESVPWEYCLLHMPFVCECTVNS